MGTGATAVNRVFPVARGRRPHRTATTKQMLTLVDLRGGAPSKVSPVQHAADHQGARDAAAVIDAVRDELDPEATASALRTWTDGLHTFAGNESALPDVKSMVKQYFDTVQQVLDSQRRSPRLCSPSPTRLGPFPIRPSAPPSTPSTRHKPPPKGSHPSRRAQASRPVALRTPPKVSPEPPTAVRPAPRRVRRGSTFSPHDHRGVDVRPTPAGSNACGDARGGIAASSSMARG